MVKKFRSLRAKPLSASLLLLLVSSLCLVLVPERLVSLRVFSAPSYQRPARRTIAERSQPDPNAPPPRELLDFQARCNADGVLVCAGFDSPGDFSPAKWPAPGLYPAGDKVFRGKFDTAIKASGAGSLRFDIPGYTGSNAAGYWRQSMEHNFGQGSTFYVQFRQRFSKTMISNKWVDTTWKQAIFHNERETCADVEITTHQYYNDGFPTMYTNCGSRNLYSEQSPPMKLQQGDYNCWYGNYNATDCFFYPVDQWITFYYQVSIGHWGGPDSAINAWVALDGKLYEQWIKMPNYRLDNDHPGNDYDTVTLLTYMTGKSDKIDYPLASTWYDELIISTRPIAPPTASGAQSSAK